MFDSFTKPLEYFASPVMDGVVDLFATAGAIREPPTDGTVISLTICLPVLTCRLSGGITPVIAKRQRDGCSDSNLSFSSAGPTMTAWFCSVEARRKPNVRSAFCDNRHQQKTLQIRAQKEFR
jgi:hypothetical protein